MRTACWITKATDTHSEYVILIASHGKNVFEDMPQWYGVQAHGPTCLNLTHTEMYLRAQYTN